MSLSDEFLRSPSGSAAISSLTTIFPSLFVNGQVFPAASASPGAIQISPNVFVNAQSFPAASVSSTPQFTGTIPSHVFTENVASSFDYSPYLNAAFNPSLHKVTVASGSMANVANDEANTEIDYNGTAGIVGATAFTLQIEDINDFATRSAGATFAQDFSVPAEVTPFFFQNDGDTALANGNLTVDQTDGPVAGSNCLRFITPASYSGTNSAVYRHPFNSAWTSNSQHFGDTPFWVQWRMKINAGRLVPSNPGLGWKFFNAAQFSTQDGGLTGVSNTLAEIVGQDTQHRGFPAAYHRDQAGSFPPFEEPYGAFDFKLQNALDNGVGLPDADRFCLYSTSGTAWPGCWHWPVDEWFTMMVRLRYGTYNGSANNEFDMWAALKDATAWTHLFSFTGFDLGGPQGGYGGSNGMHWHIYETGRISSPQDAIVKVGQIIVKTSAVALPAVGS